MRTLLISAIVWTALAAIGSAETPDKQIVVFVCEHGSAKSVIAATHFNRIAESKGLPYRAVSRGVHPDAEVPENIKSGLLADGFQGDPAKPKLVAAEDISSAARVVTMGCELPKGSADRTEKVDDWKNLPAVGNGYVEARKAIVERVEILVKELADKQAAAQK
jgi:protein-tyrosine-phosphatase